MFGSLSASKNYKRRYKKGSKYVSKFKSIRGTKSRRANRAIRGRAMAGMRLASRRYRNLLNPFPNTKLVRHKYCDVVPLVSLGAGLIQRYQWRANSTYDPDYTGVGHQPMFRDEMAAQYNYYTVLSARLIVTIPNGNGNERRWCLFCDDEDTIPTSTRYQVEEQHAVYLPGGKLDKRYLPLRLTAWYDAVKWNKTSRSGLMADDLQKVASNDNPGAKAVKYFSLTCQPMTATDTLDAINIHVQLYQTVMWREPVDHTTS